MIEQLLVQLATSPPETGDVLFLYDPETNSDLTGRGATSTLTGGAVLDTVDLIHGVPTLKFPTASAKQVITFPADLNLTDSNWTLEWSAYYDPIAANIYRNDLIVDARVSPNGIYTRFGDNGFNNRFVLADLRGSANPALTQPTPYTKTALQSQVWHWALVSIAGLVKLYCNGNQVIMALGYNSTTYNKSTFPVGGMNGLYQMRIGDANGSSVMAATGYRGRIRLSNFARYKSNYTPQLLTL